MRRQGRRWQINIQKLRALAGAVDRTAAVVRAATDSPITTVHAATVPTITTKMSTTSVITTKMTATVDTTTSIMTGTIAKIANVSIFRQFASVAVKMFQFSTSVVGFVGSTIIEVVARGEDFGDRGG